MFCEWQSDSVIVCASTKLSSRAVLSHVVMVTE